MPKQMAPHSWYIVAVIIDNNDDNNNNNNNITIICNQYETKGDFLK